MFYDRFAGLCKSRGVKPSKVALDIGCSKASVSSWKKKFNEGIDVEPTAELLNKIAEYFGVSVDYLLGNTDIQSPDRSNLTDEDVRFALFGGDAEYISDEAFDDVKRFAQIVAEKERRKRNGDLK